MRIRTRLLFLLVITTSAMLINVAMLTLLVWTASTAMKEMDVGVRQQVVALQMQAQLRDAEAALYRYLIEGESGFAAQFKRQMEHFWQNVVAYDSLSVGEEERSWAAALRATHRQAVETGGDLIQLRDTQTVELAEFERAQTQLISLLIGPVRAARPDDVGYQAVVNEMRENLRRAYLSVTFYLVAPREDETVRFSEAVIGFRQAHRQFLSLATTSQERAWAADIDQLFAKVERLGSRLMSSRNLQKAQFANFAAMLFRAGQQILGGQVQPKAAETLAQKQRQLLSTMDKVVRVTLAIVILTTLMAAGATVPMLRQVDADIRSLLQGAESVAAGNLDVTVDVRGTGELNRLAEAFNAMVGELAAREAHLHARNAELETLRQVSLKMTGTLDPKQVLNTIVTGALALVGASEAHIFVSNGEQDDGLSRAATARQHESRLPESLEIAPDHLVIEAARTGEPQVLNRIEEHTSPETREVWGRGVRAAAAFPLRLGDKTLGVFNLFFDNPHTLDEDALRILRLLADQAAIALENAHLYQNLADREARIYTLAQKLARIQEEERRLIGLDLHDGLTQLLVSANMHMSTFSTLVDGLDEQARAELALARARLHEALREARRVVSELRPAALEELGLIDGIRQYVMEVAQRENWKVAFSASPPQIRLDPAIEAAIFRIAQEAVTNARRHAETKRILLQLQVAEGELSLIVQDWGKGFDPHTVSEGRLGLVGMRERAALLGGTCSIESEPGKGTRVCVRVPIRSGGRP